MIELLSGNVILTIFLVIALGTAFGSIPFGPIRFGAAGALFVGLIVGAFVDLNDPILTFLQDLGLGIFVYMVGLEAGETFFRDLKAQLGMMLASVVAVTVGAVVAVGAGGLLNISREVAVGVFSGALTSTPSLALAQEQTGSEIPAVGYSIGYPTGVVVAILLVAVTIGRTWKAKKDQENEDEKILHPVTIAVEVDEVDMAQLDEKYGDQFVVSTLRHHGRARVAEDEVPLERGDVVGIMATRAVTDDLVAAIGRRVAARPLIDEKVTVQHFTVSNKDIAGNQVGNLALPGAFGARITRVRRADEIFLANDDTYLAYGDIVEVVLPAKRQREINSYFGDSIQSFAELDWIAVAGGLAIGFLFALIQIPLPGGSSFALGAAAGPLIAGLILGALQRTGKTAWQLPRSANYTLRQLGLMMFLAAVGTASGPAFASTAFSLQGLTAILLAVLVSIAGCGTFLLLAALLGKSATRANGGVSGMLGQPAVLQYALENSSDSRIMSGYTATFAVALIFKIVIIPFLLV